MAADMAGRTHEPSVLKPSIEIAARREVTIALDLRLLFGQWGVTRLAELRGLRLAAPQADELTSHPSAHAARVAARLPICELRRMAGAAARGRQRALEGGEARWRGPLWGDGASPVLIEKRAAGRSVAAGSRARAEEEQHTGHM